MHSDVVDAPTDLPLRTSGGGSEGRRSDSPPISDDDALELAELFRSLGDPSRVRIIAALAEGEMAVCDLASVVGISESATSHQLRSLRQLRLVRPRRDGRHVIYSLDDEHVLILFRRGLEHVEHRNA